MDHSYENEKDAVVSAAETEGAVTATGEELVHLDQEENVLDTEADKATDEANDAALDQTDNFRN